MLRLLLRTLGCVGLFCGFLIAASMDRVPDPPAIQPHAEARHSECVTAVRLQPESFFRQMDWVFRTRTVLNFKPTAASRESSADSLFAVISYATDTSPPVG